MSEELHPSALPHLAKKILHPIGAGTGLMAVYELTPPTHVTVRIQGKAGSRTPSPEEIAAIIEAPAPAAVEVTESIAAMVQTVGGTVAHVNDANHPSPPWEAQKETPK